MTTAAASATRPTAQAFPTTSDPGAPGADTTSNVARARMTTRESSSAPPLEGSFDFAHNLFEAEEMLAKFQYEDARERFLRILTRTTAHDLSEVSLIPTRCYLGLAYSYPEGNEKTDFASSASTALNEIYAKKHEWDQLSVVQKSSAYADLRFCLRRLQPLLPLGATIENGVKIAECSKFILPIDDFYAMVKEADGFSETDAGNARDVYEEALALIDGKTEIEYMVASPFGLLRLTRTYDAKDATRVQLRNRAQDAIFALFAQRALLYETTKYSRVNTFKLLISYLRDLRGLTPERHFDYRTIQEKINACRPEIPEEAAKIRVRRAAAPTSGPTGSNPLPPRSPARKATPGSPDGSWNLGRLFLAVVLLAAMTVASVALYRRYNVKVN